MISGRGRWGRIVSRQGKMSQTMLDWGTMHVGVGCQNMTSA
jgi:hypothetical protein